MFQDGQILQQNVVLWTKAQIFVDFGEIPFVVDVPPEYWERGEKTKKQKNRDHTKKSTHSYTLIYMCAADTLFVVDVLPEYWERGLKWYGVAAISRLLKIMGLRFVGSLKS